MRKTVSSLLFSALCLAVSPSFAAPNPPKGGSRSAAPDTSKSVSAAASSAAAPVAPAPAPATPAPVSAVPDTAKPAAPAAPAAPAVPLANDTASPASSERPASADTVKPPAPEATPAVASEAAAPADTAAPDSAKASSRKKRKRVVRETTVNTIDELKGRYRSPKKALFMSLIVPGLGQAYVGQHWFNYTRAGAYLLTDVGLALGWRHYVVTKQDRQIARYRAFADSNWRQDKYEDTVFVFKAKDKFSARWEHRESYCASVQSQVGTKGNSLYKACLNPEDDPTGYDEFKNLHDDSEAGKDSITALRAAFPNAHNFYELIGKEAEFIHGWLDSDNAGVDDSTHYMMVDGKKVTATSPLQKRYIGMRAQANDYARMQAWFLGGMVLNHLVSALDAAFTAHLHNKGLYQTDIGFLDRFRLDSWVAWDGGAPVPTLSASYTF